MVDFSVESTTRQRLSPEGVPATPTTDPSAKVTGRSPGLSVDFSHVTRPPSRRNGPSDAVSLY
jgi:hypothetical protein